MREERCWDSKPIDSESPGFWGPGIYIKDSPIASNNQPGLGTTAPANWWYDWKHFLKLKKKRVIKHIISAYTTATLSHFYCDFSLKRTQQVETGCFK